MQSDVNVYQIYHVPAFPSTWSTFVPGHVPGKRPSPLLRLQDPSPSPVQRLESIPPNTQGCCSSSIYFPFWTTNFSISNSSLIRIPTWYVISFKNFPLIPLTVPAIFSLLSFLSKILERLVYNAISSLHSLWNPPNQSTETALSMSPVTSMLLNPSVKSWTPYLLCTNYPPFWNTSTLRFQDITRSHFTGCSLCYWRKRFLSWAGKELSARHHEVKAGLFREIHTP